MTIPKLAPPRRFARGLVNTPADQIEVLREALDTVARINHGLHTGRFDDCDRDTCRRSRRALAVAALDLAATPEPPDSGDGAARSRSVIRRENVQAGRPMNEGIEPRDAGIDAALLERAMVNLGYAPGGERRAIVGTVITEYALLRSGSPAPEGGE